jgi:3-hydroxyacyl-CoA dehydrogenase/enoyl-CoA hydratase/3-hydroxybutyryl-CoA epimerase
MSDETIRHWSGTRDEDGILWLVLDRQDSGANTLSAEVIGELDRLLDGIEASLPRAVVIRSGKPAGFVAGADVHEFQRIQTPDEASRLIRRAHSVFARLERLPCETVTLIHGYCLGGGLELALATRHRIAEDDPRTRLGFPEVRLGIHPGFGGTVRAMRLIGHLRALDLMLSGRSVGARAARHLGLVDHAVPRRQMLRAARAVALQPPAARRLPLWQQAAGFAPARPYVARYLRKEVAKKAPERHYPAPYALIELWTRYADDPQKMLEQEVESVARLIVGETAQNLIRVFFLQEKLKALGKEAKAEVHRVHVVGAGVMGGDIAAWCAAQGLRVTLQDQSPERIAPAIGRAFKLFSSRLKEPRLVRAAMDRLVPDPRGLGLRRADVVIEAIVENAEAKRALFRAIESAAKPDALLATNTSSIPLEVIGEALSHPGRLVGLHFFNPVAKMQLIEVVHGAGTDPESVARATAFARGIDRLPLPVKSSPGFLVNRVLMPYLMEAVYAVTEGLRPELIDRAAVEFGMPMGPIELADTVGLDICLSVAEILSERLGFGVPDRLRQMVKAGQLGIKSGRGFYAYSGAKAVKSSQEASGTLPAELTDRLILSLLNEAVACLHEGVVADADALDAGIVFGTGFAPFRGGPLHYVRRSEPSRLLERLKSLQAKYGERFAPHDGWTRL